MGITITVPVEPTEKMWDGHARDFMLGIDLGVRRRDEMLKYMGSDLPDILKEELEGGGHIAKGDVCAFIWKAMIYDFQQTTEDNKE